MRLDNYLKDHTANGSSPDAATRHAIGGSGNTPSNLPSVSDDFTPSTAGSSGKGSLVPRNLEAKKDKVDGLRPLYTEGDCYCVIQLVPDSGSGGEGETFEDFILTSVSHQKTERYQIYDTFKTPILYVMDKAPEIYPFTGYFFTGRDRNGVVWMDQFLNYYETQLRATKCAETELKVFFHFSGRIVVGYVLSLAVTEAAEYPLYAQFTFNVYVTDTKYLNG